ncbi:MAG: hypothetical protein P4N60_19160 [Verrucomicrobiae bacterium]|nr:hypothetical protein [Verrucomicrobiae bacterium]
MRTESEIKALPLEDKQKLVIELRSVKTGDKAYANAKAIITLITDDKKWKEPVMVEVKNIADHDVSVDGNTIAKYATGKVFPWQLAALARFLEEVKGSAALIIAALLLVFGSGVTRAQTQTVLAGDKSGYYVVQVADQSGGAVGIPALLNTNYNAATITTNQTVVPSWGYTNGVPYNTPATNYTYVTNYAGVVPITKWSDFTLTVGCAAQGTTNITIPSGWDYSSDMVTWQTNKWLTPVTCYSGGLNTTNLDVTGVSGGYIRFGGLQNSADAGYLTNPIARVTFKFPRN